MINRFLKKIFTNVQKYVKKYKKSDNFLTSLFDLINNSIGKKSIYILHIFFHKTNNFYGMILKSQSINLKI